MRVFHVSLSSPSVSMNILAQLVSLTGVFVLVEKGRRMWRLKGSRSGFLLGEMIKKLRQAPYGGMNYALRLLQVLAHCTQSPITGRCKVRRGICILEKLRVWIIECN